MVGQLVWMLMVMPEIWFRLLISENMIELYVNDYLMNLKRVS